MQKSGSQKAPSRRQFKNYFTFRFGNLSPGARYTKWIANLVPNVLSLALCNAIFSGVVDIFKYLHRTRRQTPLMPQKSNFCQSENYSLFFLTLIFGFQSLGVMRPAATRVLSRSKGENPGEKVGYARANQASRNLKKFFGWKLGKFTLFTHFLVGWNLENLNKHPASIVFFCLRWLTTVFG